MANWMGQQLGNYRLFRLLGRSGFADTYLGEHTYLKTFAAIKMLHAQLSQSDQQAFYNEARSIARLRHPNIVRVLEFGVESQMNIPYLVIDYIPNGTLRQRHPRGTSLPPAVIVPYVKQIATALQHAHDQKLVHRDVKPENMLLGPNNEVLLSDFAISIIAQSTRTPNPKDIARTITYVAPEQIQGKPCPASDQYTLAVVVYEWLCGAVPFSGSYIETALQHERVAPPPLRGHVKTIPPDVEQVVLIALAKDPQRRFGSVLAFANALEQASKGAPSPAPQPSSPDDSQLYELTAIIPRAPSPFPAEQVIPSQTRQTSTPPPTPVAATNPSMPPPTPSAPQKSYVPPPPPPGPQAPFSAQQVTLEPPRQDSYTPQVTPAAPPQPRPVPRSPRMTILLVVLALLLIAGGSGLIYYTAVFHPNQLHAQATATSVAQITGTAQANATSTAQALATTQAQSNATATGVAQVAVQVQATATAQQTLYSQATSATPVINDPLSGGDNFGWDQYSGTPGGGCSFQGGTYHASASARYFTPCAASATNFSNFALQVQMTVISGHSGGLIFRSDSQKNNLYAFRISTDGTYILERITTDSAGHSQHMSLITGTSPAVHTGLNQSNLITVVAQGNTIYLYVNMQYVDSASDSTYKSGEIGVYSDSDAGPVEVVFTHLQAWKL